MAKYLDQNGLQSFATKLNTKLKTIFALKGEYATDEQVTTAVEGWLDTNVDPVGSAVVVDSTLSISGAAADAKVTGDIRTDVNDYINNVILVKNLAPILTQGYYANSASAGSPMSIAANSGRGYCRIKVKPSTKYAFNMDISTNFSWWAYESENTNGTSISKVSVDSNHVATSPSNANLLYVTIPGGTTSTELVVLEQDISCYGATITAYPRDTIVAVDVPLLRNSGSVENKIKSTLNKSLDFTWQSLQAKTELINISNVTDGYYVKASDGTLTANASFSVTELISALPNTLYRVWGGTSGSQVAFYDKEQAFISGSVLDSKRNFKTPDGTAYLRWCSITSNKDKYSLKISDAYLIDATEGLLNGMISAYSYGVKNVEVGPGTYNLITEYTNKYGASYFENYTDNYNGLTNGAFDRGVWLDNVKVTFNPAASVVCKYSGNNSSVRGYFSPFAIGANVEIDGLVLDSENCRYGIHPDFNPVTAERLYLILRNCDLKHFKSSLSQAIGAGLGIHSDWLFENCIFRSDGTKVVVRIHNNSDSDAQSTITIKDCYVVGNGNILLNSYSTSTLQTIAKVCGCSWVNPAVVGKETEESENNITMISWNNETRNP